jgi:hypothetical protein
VTHKPQPREYEVQCWHLQTDEVMTFFISAQEAMPRGFDGPPLRTIAGIRAREQMAAKLDEVYDPDIHKVLSIKEIY